MKFVFFGSPAFAALTLQGILDRGLVPDILVSNPDRPVGRKQVVTPPPTKEAIAARNLTGQVKVFQPEDLRSVSSQLTALSPDLFVVAAYANIIPQAVLDIPRLGTLGVHPSLLPKYRGASPIQSAILNGEQETGVSIYLLQKGVDDGPVLAKERLAIGPDETFSELLPRLAELGGRMLAGLIPAFLSGTAVPVPQDHAQATLTKKFTGADGFVPLPELQAAIKGGAAFARPIYNKIRALASEPGVWTDRGGKRIKVLEARLEDGKLVPLRIQREGKLQEPFRPGVL